MVDVCWTSLIGATTHNLGDLPEHCYTCAAHRRETMRTFMTSPTPAMRERLEKAMGVPPREDVTT